MDTTFPDDNIDPKKKGIDYCRQYAQAIYNDWSFSVPKTMFAHAGLRYEKIKKYALGIQSTVQYMRNMGVDESEETSWLNIDPSIRPIIAKFRRIALGMLQKTDYNLNFRPVDPLASDELSKFYADQKAKILLREQILQKAPQLANVPAFAKKFGDPDDLEEMQMQMDYGSKTNLSIDAEDGVQVIFQDEDNDITEHRNCVFEDFFDYGVSGVDVWIDINGRVRFEKPDMRTVVTNNCRKRNFSDLSYYGRIIDVPISDMYKYFEADEVKQIRDAAQSNLQQLKYATETNQYSGKDRTKVKVFKARWKSVNTIGKRQSINQEGNVVFKDTKFSNLKSDEKVNINGKEQPKYITKTVDVVYEAKWIIGTDFVYEYGMAKDQPRSIDPKKASRTDLGVYFFAPEFHEMRTLSIMEQLIPMADEYQLLVYKVQNLNNRMMPFGWAIDLDAIEDVAMGAGGKKLEPHQVLDMFFQSQLMVYRRKDLDKNNVNYKPIEVIQTSFAQEMTVLYEHMAQIIAQIRDISGINELVDGSSAGRDRMPNGLIAANTESANNSIYGILQGEKWLLEKLATACFMRLRIALKNGDYGGYVKAIGTNSVKAITVSPDLALHEFAISAEDMPDDQWKQMVLQEMQPNIEQGYLDLSDVVLITDMYSKKKAYMLLAYKVKKNKAAMQANALQMQQANGSTQIQSAQAAEQAKQQTQSIKHQNDMEYLNRQIEGNVAVAEINKAGAEDAAIVGAKAGVIMKAMEQAADGGGGSGLEDMSQGQPQQGQQGQPMQGQGMPPQGMGQQQPPQQMQPPDPSQQQPQPPQQ